MTMKHSLFVFGLIASAQVSIACTKPGCAGCAPDSVNCARMVEVATVVPRNEPAQTKRPKARQAEATMIPRAVELHPEQRTSKSPRAAAVIDPSAVDIHTGEGTFKPPQARAEAIMDTRAGGAQTVLSSPMYPGYFLTWFEPFIGIPGQLPSEENWHFDLGDGGWGNNEYEVYTNDTANIHITSEQNLAIVPLGSGTNWTSARITSQRSDFKTGPGGKLYIEAMLKLGDAPQSQQRGIWPAFWSMGTTFKTGAVWPGVGEWDFMEVLNGIPNMHSTIHCGYAPDGPCKEYSGIGTQYEIPFEMGVFHRVGFEVDRSMCGDGREGTWEDESLTWYLDGKWVYHIKGRDVADKEAWETLAHKDHYLLLNVAVGGNWPGYPDENTIDGPSVGMEVEYVGVWNAIV